MIYKRILEIIRCKKKDCNVRGLLLAYPACSNQEEYSTNVQQSRQIKSLISSIT